MPDYKRMDEKQADDGSNVILFQDQVDDSWFVGRPGDEGLDPIPMGSFCSAEAARSWADSHFPGGTWRPTPA